MKEIKNTIKNIKENIKLKSVVKLLVITILIIITCVISVYIQKKEKSNIKINDKEFKSGYGKISVYLSGAINNSGVYNFNDGIMLEEALNLIGGIKPEADISKLNLSKILYDSEKIVIPYVQEEQIKIDDNENIGDNDSKKVNINDANEVELMTLPGIGEVTAKKIIEYRKNGDFETIEDIKNVSGIGDSKFDKIKDKIIVE